MAAQDAELKLKVSLDLAFFRQQLTGLGQAAAGTPLKLQVQFDRRSVQNELNALGANIRRRNYYLEVKTNLEAEIKKAKQLADALNALPKGGGPQSAAGVVGKGFSQATLKGLGDDIKTLYKALGDAGLIEFNKSIANNKAKIARELSNIGQDTIAGLLNGINSNNAKISAAAQNLGVSLIASLKSVLKIQSPSREMFDIGDDAGKGFELGLLKALDIAEQSATRKMRGMLDRLARMVLMMSGMSAADIGSQAGQFRGGRALPGPSWAATVPPPQGGGGGGGRMLPPGPTFAALGGTAFGAQKYLPTALSDELKQILRGAAFAFVDSLKQQTRSVRVGLGASQQPLLAGGRIAGLLPAGVGRQASVYSTGKIGGETQAELFARREREARIRSALRGIDVMGAANREPSPYSYAYRSARPLSAIVPYAAGGALVPSSAGGGGAGGGGNRGGGFGGFGMGGFGRALGGINLPGANTIREIGTEFAFATKQVLLFGQAYKLLGFAQDLPTQVGNAVGELQSFRNTLLNITGGANEAAKANQFILETVNKYNIPLQSARDGFTKLFASMAPAGFSAGEIQDLFLGISKASATFGMSADKVDRVNYAFAQMASKGQVMSEELKGQLGDVLPGAMGIFAKAAGFKGPDAIQKFGKALEDGVYKGQAMRDLLKNVTIVMNQEFGPGAEGAAQTFQGVINRMQNSMKLFYESFEPVAVGFLNTVVVPITGGIKTITDGFTAFFSGTQAKTAGGSAFAAQLQELKPAFDGIRQNIQSLLPLFNQFGQILLQVGKALIQIAGNPIVGYLAKLYLVALPINLIFGRIVASVGSVYTAMTTLNVGLLAGAQRFKTVDMVMKGFGLTAAQATGILRGVAPALNAVTLGLKAFGSTAILFGITAIIERIMSLKGAIDSVRQSTQMMLANISSMANSGAVGELKNLGKDIAKQISTFENLRPYVSGQGGRGIPSKRLTPEVAATMKEIGLGGFIGEDLFGKPYVKDFINASNIIEERLKSLRKSAASVKEKLPLSERIAADLARQTKPATITPIKEEAAVGKRKPTAYYGTRVQELKNEFEKGKAVFDQQLASEEISKRQYEIDLAEFKLKKDLLIIEELYAVATKKASLSRMTAADKELALNQAKANKESAIAKATAQRDTSIAKANKELRKPIIDSIFQETLASQKSAQEIENLKNGIKGLTPEQEAEFIITEKLYGMKTKDKEAIQDRIDTLREQIILQKQNLKLLEQEANLFNLREQIKTAGAGIGAGYFGSAAQTYETALQQPGATPEYAKQMADLETQAMKLQTVFGGIQNAIGGIGDAFGTMMTKGIYSMIEGTATAQEVFSEFLKTIANTLLEASSQIIATYMSIGLARMFAGMGGGGGGSSLANFNAGAAQYGGGAGGAATMIDFGGIIPKANGGIFAGGFQAFASGGIVSGPTMGLVGEGRYNEAIVPLPDGKSIPVELGGGMGGTNVIVNVDAKGTRVSGDQGNAQALAKDIAGVVDQRIIYHKRAGGLLSR